MTGNTGGFDRQISITSDKSASNTEKNENDE
jgi:hypothetical protein